MVTSNLVELFYLLIEAFLPLELRSLGWKSIYSHILEEYMLTVTKSKGFVSVSLKTKEIALL